MEDHAKFGRLSKDRHGAGCTPFRYPGGKAFLADLLDERIRASDGLIETYAEPYAGGAGAAVELLARGTVQKIALNDFDRRVHAAWWAILHETDALVERILNTPISMESWRICHQIVAECSDETDLFELGFATYFLNRTNHSGVILGAGPIGGYGQNGKWLMEARYYPETMAKRIRWLGDRRHQISLTNADGLAFLKTFDEEERQATFFFIDPPYVMAGKRLYLDAMSDKKHRDLARFLMKDKTIPNWLVTYDHCQWVRDAYSSARIEMLPVRYSLRNKRTENEVCVVPS
jgi:DNA adenine methylase